MLVLLTEQSFLSYGMLSTSSLSDQLNSAMFTVFVHCTVFYCLCMFLLFSPFGYCNK